MEGKPKSKKGFGSMDKARLHEISSRGGSSVPAAKRFFADRALAAEYGRKGGLAKRRKKPSVD